MLQRKYKSLYIFKLPTTIHVKREVTLAPKRGMYRFSDHFQINKKQSQLDFVDIPLDTDIRLYVDPYALYISPVDWIRTAGALVVGYFDRLLEALKKGDRAKAMKMLAHLHEPNETKVRAIERLSEWTRVG